MNEKFRGRTLPIDGDRLQLTVKYRAASNQRNDICSEMACAINIRPTLLQKQHLQIIQILNAHSRCFQAGWIFIQQTFFQSILNRAIDGADF